MSKTTTKSFIQRLGLKQLFIGLIGLTIAAIVWYALSANIFSLHSAEFDAWLKQFSGWQGPVVLLLLIIAEIVIAPLPGGWLVLVGAILYGPWLGFLIAYIGATIGSYVAFELARYFGQPFVRAMVSEERFKSWEKKLHTSRWGILAIYMIPLFPVDIVSLLLGLTSISRKRFILLMTIGFIPNIAALTFFSAYLYQNDYQYVLIGLMVAVATYFLVNGIRVLRK